MKMRVDVMEGGRWRTAGEYRVTLGAGKPAPSLADGFDVESVVLLPNTAAVAAFLKHDAVVRLYVINERGEGAERVPVSTPRCYKWRRIPQKLARALREKIIHHIIDNGTELPPCQPSPAQINS